MDKIIEFFSNIKTIELVANIVGVCAVIMFVLSYQMKKRQNIVLCNVISRVLYVAQYLLLGAFEGAVLDIVGVFASVLAQNKDSKYIKKYQTAVIIGVNVVIVAAGLLLYENVFSLLPMFGVLFHTGAFWFSNEKKIRFMSFAGSPFWFAYNFISGAYGSCIGDILSMVSIAISMYRYDFKKQQ